MLTTPLKFALLYNKLANKFLPLFLLSSLKWSIGASFFYYNIRKQELLSGSLLLVMYVHKDLRSSFQNDRVVLNTLWGGPNFWSEDYASYVPMHLDSSDCSNTVLYIESPLPYLSYECPFPDEDSSPWPLRKMIISVLWGMSLKRVWLWYEDCKKQVRLLTGLHNTEEDCTIFT